MIEPPVFDVSGAHGAPGDSGYSYTSTASRLVKSRTGGDGTDGQHGASAANISMRLATPLATAIPKNVVLANPIDANVKLDANFVYTTGQLVKMDTILKIKSRETMCFHAVGGNGGRGGNGGNGQHGANGYRYGTFLVLSSNESISEYAWRTGERMQLERKTVLMAVPVVTEEMAVMQVEVVMVDLEEPFKSLFSKPTLILLCSLVPSNMLAEEGAQQGNQGSEVGLFLVILPPTSSV